MSFETSNTSPVKSQESDQLHNIESRSKVNLFVEFHKDYIWEAVNHYLICKRRTLTAGNPCNFSTSAPEQCLELQNKLLVYRQRQTIIENLHNYFVQDQRRHIEALMSLIPCNEAFENISQKTEVDALIQCEFIQAHGVQHSQLMKTLLQMWNMWDDNFEEKESQVHICNVAKDILNCKCSELKKLNDSIEDIRSLFWRRISREDFLNHENAIRTIQRHIRSCNIRSTIEHMMFRPKNIVHVGGSILDLSMEEMLAGKSIHKLDLTEEKPKWQRLSETLPKLTTHAGVTSFGNKVYIAGGRNSCGSYLLSWDAKAIVYNSAYMLTLHDDKIQTLPSMGSARSHHGFVAFKGSLWAIGGSDGTQALDTVESFDPMKKQWFKRPSLQQQRSGAAVSVHDDTIWVIGGRNSSNNILSSVEVYDPKEKKWIYSPNIPKPLLLSAAVSNMGQLFLVGGVTGTKDNLNAESAIYRWDSIAKNWKYWNKMQEPRLNHSVTRYGECIQVCGGHGLAKGVPTHVTGAINFKVNSNDKEIYSPKIGTQRIGVGIAMVGDAKVIENIVQNAKCSTIETWDRSRSDCLSCVSSFICNNSNSKSSH